MSNPYAQFDKVARLGGIAASLANSIFMWSRLRPDNEMPATDLLLTSMFAVLAFALTVTLIGRSSRTKKVRGLLLSGLSLVALGVLYYVMYAFFTGLDATGDRYIKGFRYSATVVEYKKLKSQEVADGKDHPGSLLDDEIVDKFGNNPRKVWTTSTVDLSALVLRVLLYSSACSAAVTMAFLTKLISDPRVRVKSVRS